MRDAITATLFLAGLSACQSNITTPFPAGLEPLEDNLLPDPADRSTEVLTTTNMNDGMIRVYGKGYVLAPPATVWAASKDPAAMYAACSTDHQSVTPEADPRYELIYLVHYEVDDILTVTWDDEWRYGVIDDPDFTFFGMIKHQKVMGSSFITLSEGTVQILGTDDPNVTELAFVEHLDAISGGTGDVVDGMQHNFDALVAGAHGQPIPPCP